MPVLVQMNYLEEAHRPKSDDPEYWKIWTDTGENARTVDWGTVADNWQEKEQNDNKSQELDEFDAEQQEKDSDYGDLCHEQKDQQAMSNTNTDSKPDDEEFPF